MLTLCVRDSEQAGKGAACRADTPTTQQDAKEQCAILYVACMPFFYYDTMTMSDIYVCTCR